MLLKEEVPFLTRRHLESTYLHQGLAIPIFDSTLLTSTVHEVPLIFDHCQDYCWKNRAMWIWNLIQIDPKIEMIVLPTKLYLPAGFIKVCQLVFDLPC